MAVGFQVSFLWFSVGTGDFLHSFFSTVCVNLENSTWGSRFPVVMNSLYSGNVDVEDLPTAQTELNLIGEELAKIAPSEVVWDAEDLSIQPPWGDNISPDIQTLADYHVTNDGRNLISVLALAIEKGISLKSPLEVREI